VVIGQWLEEEFRVSREDLMAGPGGRRNIFITVSREP
jgi:hypothetical protein